MTTIKGNYELRIATIDVDRLSETDLVDLDDDEQNIFLEKAEQLGTVYTLGGFIEKVNLGEDDNFTNSYIRAFLINKDEPEEIVSIDDFNTLYLYSGEIKQR